MKIVLLLIFTSVSLLTAIWVLQSEKAITARFVKTLPSKIIASHIFDANEDGKLDILISHKDFNFPSELLLINRGVGFEVMQDAFPAHYKGNDGETLNLISADFNNDGHIDVLAVTADGTKDYRNRSSKIHLYLGDGTGKFTDHSEKIYPNKYDHWVEWVRVADFDGDGSQDFLLTDPGKLKPKQNIGGRIYLNDGKGKFKLAVIEIEDQELSYSKINLSWRRYGLGTPQNEKMRYALDVFVGNLNKDKLPDIVIPGSYISGVLASFINKSSPHKLKFEVIYSEVEEKRSDYSYPIIPVKNGVLVDLNGDGHLDIVGSRSIANDLVTPEKIRILINNKKNEFFVDDSYVARSNLGVLHARQWHAHDFDKDGKEEILIADHGPDVSPHGGAPNLLLTINNGKLVNDIKKRISDESSFTHGVAIGDINGDGYTDIFFNNPENQLWINNGKGKFFNKKIILR